MHGEVHRWVPPLTGTILEIGKRVISGTSPYPTSYGVDMLPGEGVKLVCNAEKLPFEDASWDHVVCLETFEHMEHWRECLREMWRVLRGTMVITTPTNSKGYHGYPDDFWRWTLEQWLQVFHKQKVLKSGMVWKKGIGIHVEKRNSKIDLTVEPERIKRR